MTRSERRAGQFREQRAAKAAADIQKRLVEWLAAQPGSVRRGLQMGARPLPNGISFIIPIHTL